MAALVVRLVNSAKLVAINFTRGSQLETHCVANGADPATKEALRYRTALSQGFEQLADRSLRNRTAVQICSELEGCEVAVRKVQALLTLPILFLSRYVVQYNSEYYRLLNSVTVNGDCQLWFRLPVPIPIFAYAICRPQPMQRFCCRVVCGVSS